MEDIVFVKITRGIDCRLSLSVVSGSKNKKQQPNRQTSVLRILYFSISYWKHWSDSYKWKCYILGNIYDIIEMLLFLNLIARKLQKNNHVEQSNFAVWSTLINRCAQKVSMICPSLPVLTGNKHILKFYFVIFNSIFKTSIN